MREWCEDLLLIALVLGLAFPFGMVFMMLSGAWLIG